MVLKVYSVAQIGSQFRRLICTKDSVVRLRALASVFVEIRFLEIQIVGQNLSSQSDLTRKLQWHLTGVQTIWKPLSSR